MRISDWSSDVCSSDLIAAERHVALLEDRRPRHRRADAASERDEEGIARCLEQGGVKVLIGGAAFGRRERVFGHVGERLGHRRDLRLGAALRGERGGLRLDDLAQQIGRATSELQSLMRISYAVFCLKKKKVINHIYNSN